MPFPALRKQRVLFAVVSLSFLLLVGGLSQVQATIMKFLEVEELTRLATDVFHGQVVSTRAYWSDDHKRIYTAVRVQVEENFKGRAKRGDVLTLTQLGGELDGLRLDYSGRPEFTVGETVVLFTKSEGKSGLTVVGLKQGKLRVTAGEATRDFSGLTLVDKLTPGAQARASVTRQTRFSLAELRQRIARAL